MKNVYEVLADLFAVKIVSVEMDLSARIEYVRLVVGRIIHAQNLNRVSTNNARILVPFSASVDRVLTVVFTIMAFSAAVRKE